MEKNEKFKSELENQYNILIQAQEKSEKRRFIILCSIVLISLVSVLVSTIFSYMAYKNTIKTTTNNKSETNIYYQTLSTTYSNNSKLDLSKIVTGYRLASPKTISITNDGDTTITYNIKLSSIKTSLLSTNNLEYTLYGSGESITKSLPLSDKVILENITIAPNETKTYTLNVEFKGVVDAEETNNYYNAIVEVEQVNNKANLLE